MHAILIIFYIDLFNNKLYLFDKKWRILMLPIHINIGFLHLNDYEGIYFFIAILSALIYFTYLAKDENIDIETMYEAIFISLIVALITGRLFSFLFWSPIELFKNPIIFFQVWKGGITVTGGVLGGLIAGSIYAYIKKLHFFHHIKIFIPPIILGHIIGRIGCFLNGDASGFPTKMPWGIVFDPASVAYRFTGIQPGTPLHPTQLYEILGNIILLFIIIMTGNNKWITNRRIIWYALGYGTIRFIVESFRNDSEHFSTIPFLTSGQIICLIFWGIGIALLIWSIFNNNLMEAKEENIARAKAK